MSPELFDSKVQDHRRTKRSDCYALGMVIYEVLSRQRPFYQYANLVVFGKVAGGSRPERPRGTEAVWFTDDVWEMLGRCWVPQPEHCPSVKDVLRCLEEVSRSWVLPPQLPEAPSTVGSLTQDFCGTTTMEHTDGTREVTLSQPSEKLDLEESGEIVDMVRWTSSIDEFWY